MQSEENASAGSAGFSEASRDEVAVEVDSQHEADHSGAGRNHEDVRQPKEDHPHGAEAVRTGERDPQDDHRDGADHGQAQDQQGGGGDRLERDDEHEGDEQQRGEVAYQAMHAETLPGGSPAPRSSPDHEQWVA